ncbi:VanZ family protein, partial [Streptococcus pseudopneumoniae]
IGGLFKFNFKTVMRFIFFITIIETSQYVFHLGFFDIGDIFTNTIGFIIGSNIHDSRLGKKIIHYIK